MNSGGLIARGIHDGDLPPVREPGGAVSAYGRIDGIVVSSDCMDSDSALGPAQLGYHDDLGTIGKDPAKRDARAIGRPGRIRFNLRVCGQTQRVACVDQLHVDIEVIRASIPDECDTLSVGRDAGAKGASRQAGEGNQPWDGIRGAAAGNEYS